MNSNMDDEGFTKNGRAKIYLSLRSKTCRKEPFTINSVTVAKVPPGPSLTTP